MLHTMFREVGIALLLVACGGTQSAASDCPRGKIETQTQADMAVDMANRMCGAIPEGDEPKETMAVEGVLCTSFGEAAETGRCGYPRDVVSARRYYEHACAGHYQPACNALARMRQP
jgi:hypothetical protein